MPNVWPLWHNVSSFVYLFAIWINEITHVYTYTSDAKSIVTFQTSGVDRRTLSKKPLQNVERYVYMFYKQFISWPFGVLLWDTCSRLSLLQYIFILSSALTDNVVYFSSQRHSYSVQLSLTLLFSLARTNVSFSSAHAHIQVQFSFWHMHVQFSSHKQSCSLQLPSIFVFCSANTYSNVNFSLH